MSGYQGAEHLDQSWKSLHGISRSLAKASRIMKDMPSSPSPEPEPEPEPQPENSFDPVNVDFEYGCGRAQLLHYRRDFYTHSHYRDECVNEEMKHLPNLSTVDLDALRTSVEGQFDDSDEKYPEEPSFFRDKKSSKPIRVAHSQVMTKSPLEEGLEEVSMFDECFIGQEDDAPANDVFSNCVDESMLIKGVLPSPTSGNTPSPCSSPLPYRLSIGEHSDSDVYVSAEMSSHSHLKGNISPTCTNEMKDNPENELETCGNFESTPDESEESCIALPAEKMNVARTPRSTPEVLKNNPSSVPSDSHVITHNNIPPKKIARLFSSTKPRRCRNALILNLLKKQNESQNHNGKMPGTLSCQVYDIESRMSEAGNEVSLVSSSETHHRQDECSVTEEIIDFHNSGAVCELSDKEAANGYEFSTSNAGLNDTADSDETSTRKCSSYSHCASPQGSDKTAENPVDSQTYEPEDFGLDLSTESSPYCVCLDLSMVPDLSEPQHDVLFEQNDMVLDDESFLVSEEEASNARDSHFYRDNTFRPIYPWGEESSFQPDQRVHQTHDTIESDVDCHIENMIAPELKDLYSSVSIEDHVSVVEVLGSNEESCIQPTDKNVERAQREQRFLDVVEDRIASKSCLSEPKTSSPGTSEDRTGLLSRGLDSTSESKESLASEMAPKTANENGWSSDANSDLVGDTKPPLGGISSEEMKGNESSGLDARSTKLIFDVIAAETFAEGVDSAKTLRDLITAALTLEDSVEANTTPEFVENTEDIATAPKAEENPPHDPIVHLAAAMAEFDLNAGVVNFSVDGIFPEAENTCEETLTSHHSVLPRQPFLKLLSPNQFQNSGVDPEALGAALSKFEEFREPGDVD